MSEPLVLVAFMVIVIGGGLLIGFITRPDAWYAGLTKPWFNPPSWVFAPVWTLLYFMIAVAGARTFGRGLDAAFGLWLAQLALNFAWSPVFFRLHRPGIALAIVVGLLSVVVGFIVQRWQIDRTTALLFVPYACWVAFASILNASIFRLN
jgi:tryptophan-rich sensory protein